MNLEYRLRALKKTYVHLQRQCEREMLSTSTNTNSWGASPKKRGYIGTFLGIFFILDHYSKVKKYLGKVKKFKFMLSTKKD